MLTVNPAELHGMLTDLLRSAGADVTLPMLNGVLLFPDTKGDATVLVGASTDRFRLGQAHAPATGEIPPTFLKVAQVKQLLDVLKPYARSHDLLSEVTVDERVKFTLKLPGDIVLPSMTVTVHCENDENFPKVAKVLDKVVVPGEGQVAFNAAYMASFGAIAKRRNEYMRIEMSHGGEKLEPTRIYIGSQYRAILMPVRAEQAGVDIAPQFTPPREKPVPAEAQPAA